VSEPPYPSYGGFLVSSQAEGGTSVNERREEFELRFWVVRETLRAIREGLVVLVAAALAIYFVVALAEGRVVAPDELLRTITRVLPP
jgi:hypothetical protein